MFRKDNVRVPSKRLVCRTVNLLQLQTGRISSDRGQRLLAWHVRFDEHNDRTHATAKVVAAKVTFDYDTLWQYALHDR